MSMTAVDPSAGRGIRNTRGRTPVYDPRLNNEPFDITVNSLSAVFSEGQHDAITLTCISTTLETTDDMLNSTLTFRFGVPPHVEQFYGYIADVTDVQESAGQLSFTLSVLGPTKMLFDGKPRFWALRSATNVITELTSTALLGSGGHEHPYIWKSLAQTSESDWEMVNSLAKRIGWSVMSRYGVVLVFDPDRLYRESGPYATLRSGVTETNSEDRILLSFESTALADLLTENLGSRFAYFTETGVQVITQEGDFKGYSFDTSTPVRDAAEAQTRMQATTVRLDSWAENAVARLWGDADLYPGQCVNIVTVEKKYITAKHDGKWLIRNVGHQADRQQYQTILYLTRPTQAAPYVATYRPFWEEVAKSKPYLYFNLDRWESSWADPRFRSLQ